MPLFGAGGTPSDLDVNHGNCYFVSALGETALQDPSLIKTMIANNGSGAYSVLFYVNGQADYATTTSKVA